MSGRLRKLIGRTMSTYCTKTLSRRQQRTHKCSEVQFTQKGGFQFTGFQRSNQDGESTQEE